jgi:CarD family transcriptional regulator, regulator of rRNA transcription
MNLQYPRHRFDNAGQTHEAKTDVSERPHNAPVFSANEFVVYPAHGVGQVIAIEVQTVAGATVEFFVLYFARSKMTLRVPTQKAESVGMRKLSSPTVIQHVRQTLLQAAPRTRISWLRLAKEYEAKIKSGNIIAIAEVVRDLCRRSVNSEQSYSESQLYVAALDRLSGEVARVEGVTEETAISELETLVMTKTGSLHRAAAGG